MIFSRNTHHYCINECTGFEWWFEARILRIILVTFKVWLKRMLKLSVTIFIIAPVNEHAREVFLCLPLLSSFIMSNFIWSDVWEHFKKGEEMTMCCHCCKELSYCGGMTNLSDHLMRIHPFKYITKADKNKVSTAKINTFVNKVVYSKSHAKKITNLMAEMLVLNLRPAATVEGVCFRRLINYLEPDGETCTWNLK